MFRIGVLADVVVCSVVPVGLVVDLVVVLVVVVDFVVEVLVVASVVLVVGGAEVDDVAAGGVVVEAPVVVEGTVVEDTVVEVVDWGAGVGMKVSALTQTT